MRKLFCDLTMAITLVVSMIIFSSSNAISQVKYRHCTIKEIIDSGGYTFIRCDDGNDDIWLSTPQKKFEYGEKVTFEDTPPMVNFSSKTLGKTFPLIRFTPQVVKYGSLKSNSVDSDVSTINNGKTTSSNNEDIYSGTDDNGTLVFSDDPSKVKNIRTPNRKKAAKQSHKTSRAQWGINKTISIDFSNRDKEIILAMEKVAKAMCTSDTTLMKSLMYQPAWEQYEKGIEMDIKKAMKYYHRDCPKSFIVKDVEYNDQENSATLLMDAEFDFGGILGESWGQDCLSAIRKGIAERLT